MKIVCEGINPKVAMEWVSFYDEVPEDLRHKVSDLSLRNPVSNLGTRMLFFTDSSIFSPAANTFRKSEEYAKKTGTRPSFCPGLIPGTPQYKAFWKEERRRCIEGYEPLVDGKPCGIKITGEHYFYLNYCPIIKKYIDPVTKKKVKKRAFPDFLSMDYYWFHQLELAENPEKFGLPPESKQPLIMAKSRRKGWSFKNAAGAVHIYTFTTDGRVVILSQLGDKGKNTFNMALDMIDFINEHTEFSQPWIRRANTKNECYIKSGWREVVNGQEIEKGRKSIIEAVSLKDKPDGAAGLYATRVLFEEAGQIKDLDVVWRFTEPLIRDGEDFTGMAIIYGTGGDMEKGAEKFAEIFNKPEEYGIKAYRNIYEETVTEESSGYFVDDMWFRPGTLRVRNDSKGYQEYEAVDKNGNPNRWVAEILVDQEREQAKKNKRRSYTTLLTQKCKTPSEAFLRVKGNIMPVAELQEALSRKIVNKEFRLYGTRGYLVENGNEVTFKPDLKNELFEVDSRDNDREGCVVMYQAPIYDKDGVIPRGLYIVTMDPIAIDNDGGESLCAIYVVKTSLYPHLGSDEIVMSYVGRAKEDPIDTANSNALKMCKMYSAMFTHENDRSGKVVRDYFIKNGGLFFMLKPPGSVVSKHISDSATLNRQTGHSMSSEEMKEIGEIYTKKWLLKKIGVKENGEPLRVLDKIPEEGLYRELLAYNRTGNYDRVSALFGAVIQMQAMHNEFIKKEDENINRERKESRPTSFAQLFDQKFNSRK